MSITKLPHWVITDKYPAFYDSESATAIEQTAKVYGAMQELIDGFNEQDEKIDDSILYMKNNLANSLEELMNQLLKNGYVDERVKENMNNLIERLDNLLGTVKEGTSTLDAEVIDIRTDINGGVHLNAGTSIRRQFINEAYTRKDVVTTLNYQDVLPDVNLIDEPCTYQLNFNYGSSDISANLPYTEFKGSIDELITFKDKYYRQILIGDKYIYTRNGVKTADGFNYNEWVCIYNKEKEDLTHKNSFKSKGIVDDSNYLEVLPDANKILENSSYQLNFSYNNENITGNLPYTVFKGRIDELITFADHYYRQLLISDKYIYMRNGILAQTKDSVDYGEWILIWSSETNKESLFVVDKNGTGDYTSLTKCVFDNLGTKNIIHVKPGTYDLISEFKEYFGSDYFTRTSLPHQGLVVKNGTKFMLDSGAEITFLYDGSNNVVEEYFSPFIMENDGGEIHGGRIICTNCRYAIHDDVYDSSSNSKSVIEGVYMHYTGTRNVGIGGGLGQSSHITVRNCVVINGNDSIGYGIFYHNAATGNSKSHITIENNVVKDNIVIEPYGTSDHVSTAIVCGNKCNDVKKIMGGNIDNITLYDFNNVKEV